jgi:hypothetical protein
VSTPAPAKPYSFYKLLPDGRWALFVDATLIKDFNTCERRFWFKHILNLRAKSPQARAGFISFPISIGGWWSDVMEELYTNMQKGVDTTNIHIQDIAVRAWIKNKIDEGIQFDRKRFERFGNLAGAVLMLQQYKNSQWDIDRLNWKIVGAELGFGLNKEIKIGETKKVVVYWVGKPDLVVIERDKLVPVDHKTVDRIDGRTTDKYKPGPQMPGYCFAVETLARQAGIDRRVDRCVVNICARSRPADKPRDGKVRPRYIRSYPSYTREEISEWRSNILTTCERLARCLETREWQWGYQSCHNIYMRECEFLGVDRATPSARDMLLNVGFQTSEPWRPYQPQFEDEGGDDD